MPVVKIFIGFPIRTPIELSSMFRISHNVPFFAFHIKNIFFFGYHPFSRKIFFSMKMYSHSSFRHKNNIDVFNQKSLSKHPANVYIGSPRSTIVACLMLVVTATDKEHIFLGFFPVFFNKFANGFIIAFLRTELRIFSEISVQPLF